MARPTATRGLLTVLFFWSSTPVVAALGLGRTRFLTFVTITGLGNLATSVFFVSFGRRFSEHVSPATDWLSAHGTVLTAVLALLVVASATTTLIRARSRELPSPASPPSRSQSFEGRLEGPNELRASVRL